MSLRSSVHGFDSKLGLCFFCNLLSIPDFVAFVALFPLPFLLHFVCHIFFIFDFTDILCIIFHFSFRSGVFVLFVDSFATVLSLNCLFISYFDV